VSDESQQMARAIIDSVRRMAIHYGLWFANSVHKFGIDQALEMEKEAGDRATGIVLDRLAATLGNDLIEGLPAALVNMESEKQKALLSTLAVNWLALDGVWFQAVEQREGMAAAKEVNDACWSHFSPLEAARIK